MYKELLKKKKLKNKTNNPVQNGQKRDFPGGPVVKAPPFHCRGHGFDPWCGDWGGVGNGQKI